MIKTNTVYNDKSGNDKNKTKKAQEESFIKSAEEVLGVLSDEDFESSVKTVQPVVKPDAVLTLNCDEKAAYEV